MTQGATEAAGIAGDCHGYPPIRDYALIGDCHGCALVSCTGSVDWCAFQRFDAAPAFCRLLDRSKGGFLSTTPSGSFEAKRAYLDGTNVLRTILTGPGGKVALTDYMPVGRRPGAGIHDYTTLVSPNLLIRTIECVAGDVLFDVAFRPSLDYARRPARLYPGAATGALFAHPPRRVSLPRKGCRVGLRIVLFEACSAFTRVTACTLALPPIRDTLSEGFIHFVTSIAAPVASGWSGCRVGLAPTGKAPPFHGAHPFWTFRDEHILSPHTFAN